MFPTYIDDNLPILYLDERKLLVSVIFSGVLLIRELAV